MKSLSLFDLNETAPPAEELSAVLHELTPHCTQCRLGFLKGSNSSGLFQEGNPALAQIAFVADYPYPLDLTRRSFLEASGRKDFLQWLKPLKLELPLLYLYLVQCQTPFDKHSKGFRAPFQDELQRCFLHRTLRLLQALPQLECVVTLGGLATEMLLGTKQTFKTLEGGWFGTDRLNGIPVFVLPHPREVEEAASWRKRGRARQLLRFFAEEFLVNQRIAVLLDKAEARRRQERKAYVLDSGV